MVMAKLANFPHQFMSQGVPYSDYLGKTFNSWTIVADTSTPAKGKGKYVLCRCVCGREAVLPLFKVIRGASKRCKRCLGVSQRKDPQNVAEKRLWANYTLSAVRRKLTFNLSRELFQELVSGSCTYCGIEPEAKVWKLTEASYTYKANGIDRIDPTKGYEPDNVVSCCTTCNFAKGKLGADQWRDWLHRAAKHQVKNFPQLLQEGVNDES